ncbi:adhesion G protein-coupled receptor E3-like [Colossoma macropomum]|uniref:adhesion G protein-coupled receptor E3-like n=1 Tax=Colossoma macropomum TaxID=42526 RepID=UPI0018652F21|nr:adhesion G protein-coupled receptor E3-like [Colossoma macropomum]
MTKYLNEEMNCVKAFEGTTTDKHDLGSYGNSVLEATEKLVSGLVMKTDTYYSISINLQTVDVEVFVVGPNTSLTEIPQLNTSNAYLDIDLIGIAKNNNGFAAVAFISYTNLSNILNPSLIKHGGRDKVFLSTVVSVILINVTNTQFTKPARITFKHFTEVHPKDHLSCVTWKGSEWMNEGQNIVQTNSTHTVVFISYPGTFAVIMQISCSPEVISKDLYLLNVVSVAVGLGFLSLTLLTFAIFRHSKMNRMAQVNLSISLLLSHLLFLLTAHFLDNIYASQLVCKVVAGVLHFLFLSAFVWMFIDAVLLFISARNLTKITSNQREVLGWKSFTVIGYLIPLIIVGISAGIVPGGYGSKKCWLKIDKDFFWSFLGPVCCILGLNLILFVAIFINVTFTLKNLNSEILQRKNTPADKKVIQSVMLKTMAQLFILGCPWILGLFTCNHKVLEIIFLFLNSQQGTFIFFIHCVLNKEIREQCRMKFCLRKKPITSNSDIQIKQK